MPTKSTPIQMLVMVNAPALRLQCEEALYPLDFMVYHCPPGRASLAQGITLARPVAVTADWALLRDSGPLPKGTPLCALVNSDAQREDALAAGCHAVFALPADWRYIGLSCRRRLGLPAFPAHLAEARAKAYLNKKGISDKGAGTRYLLCALSFLQNDPAMARVLYKQLYPLVAQVCDTGSPAAVAKGIERTLHTAWKNGGLTGPVPSARSFLQCAALEMPLMR